MYTLWQYTKPLGETVCICEELLQNLSKYPKKIVKKYI